MKASDVIDAALEASVVGSFSRIGPTVRRQTDRWGGIGNRARGKTVAITGATSGLGRAAAETLGRAGATVLLLVRNRDRGESVARDLKSRGAARVEVVDCDISDFASVRAAAKRLNDDFPALDVLIHNAGVLGERYTTTSDGIETTFATHIAGPFLLTHLVAPALVAARGRVIVVTSGGMYTAALRTGAVEPVEEFSGAAVYAAAKRQQVAIVDTCGTACRAAGVDLVAMHPGWADTPGVAKSLPTFHRYMKPLLRTPEDGADTMVWLATTNRKELSRGPLWLDRRPRGIHRLATTRRSDTPQARAELIDGLRRLTGLDSETASVFSVRH